MLTRDDIYTPGLPAEVPHAPLIDFAMKHAGESVIDIGCGSGAYSERLQELGKSVVGLEADRDSIREAIARGLEVSHGDATSLPFEDNQFDSALLFEVLEHIPNFTAVVRGALRVTRRNVLVTVPNVGEYEYLKRYGITYWHLVTTDHVNFFEPADLVELAESCHAHADVRRDEPLVPAALLRPRRPLWFAVSALRRLGLVRPIAYRRLYAVIEPAR